MIKEANAKKYCSEDISLIENYDKAILDQTQTWECHHKDELQADGTIVSRQQLIKEDRYYNVPACKLVFLSVFEHNSIHHKNIKQKPEHIEKRVAKNIGQKRTATTKIKMSKAKLGNTNVRGTRWWNNGIKNTRAKDCPDGFVPGRLNK